MYHYRSVSCRGGRFKGVDKFFARMSSDVQGISLNIHQTHNTTDRHLYCKYQTCVFSHSKMAVRLAFTAPTTLEAPGICSIAGQPAKLDASLVQVEHLTESTISAPAIPTQSANFRYLVYCAMNAVENRKHQQTRGNLPHSIFRRVYQHQVQCD